MMQLIVKFYLYGILFMTQQFPLSSSDWINIYKCYAIGCAFSHHKSIHQMNNIMNNLNAITNFMGFCGSFILLWVCDSVEKPCQGTNWKSIIIAAGQKWVDLNRSNIGFRVGQSFLFHYSQYKALTRWVGWMNEWVSECVRVNGDDGRFFQLLF